MTGHDRLHTLSPLLLHPAPDKKLAMEKIRNVVGNLLGSLTICVGLWSALQDHVSAATACFSAGVLILLVANINHFEFIKGFGFEARTKKLDEKIEEADRLVEQLRRASQLFTDISVHLMSRAGRWSGPIPKPETQELVTRIETLLSSLGVEKDQIDESLGPFHRITLRDLGNSSFNRFFAEMDRHVQHLNGELQNWIKENSPLDPTNPHYAKLLSESQNAQKYAQDVRQRYNDADPFTLDDLLERAVAEAPSWTDVERREFFAGVKELLHEYRYYAKHLRINNLTSWLARDYGH